jgi:hypothetical protein
MKKNVQILNITIFVVVLFFTTTNGQETEWYFFDQPIYLYETTTSS